MGYRILADENVERVTINYFRKLDHDDDPFNRIDEIALGHELPSYRSSFGRSGKPVESVLCDL